MKTTKVINMSEYLDSKCESTKNIQARMMCAHARTMCMMYEATKEVRYLQQARLDIAQARSILQQDFIRPLGVIITKVA